MHSAMVSTLLGDKEAQRPELKSFEEVHTNTLDNLKNIEISYENCICAVEIAINNAERVGKEFKVALEVVETSERNFNSAKDKCQ